MTLIRKHFIFLVLLLVVFAGCNDTGEDNPGDFEHITEEAKAFADEHFLELQYRTMEYQIASLQEESKEVFQGSRTEWESLLWEEKIPFLPSCFLFDLSPEKDLEYYDLIGRYPLQFGFGWDDETHEPFSSCWEGDSSNLAEYRAMLGLG